VTSLTEIIGTRELFVNLTLRELRGKYKRSMLGWAWSLLNPLATMVIFTLVFSVILKADPPPGQPSGLKSYPLFLLCALLPWNFLSLSITGAMGALLGNANLIKKVWFPREVLVLSNTAASLVSFLVEMGVLGIVLLVAGNFVLPWLLVALFYVALLALFCAGVGLVLGVLNVYFRDVGHFVGIFLQIWFYATPIVYPVTLVDRRASGLARFLYGLNPMTRFAEAFRALLYDLRFPPLVTTLGLVVVSVATFAGGREVFRRFEPRLAEEL